MSQLSRELERAVRSFKPQLITGVGRMHPTMLLELHAGQDVQIVEVTDTATRIKVDSAEVVFYPNPDLEVWEFTICSVCFFFKYLDPAEPPESLTEEQAFMRRLWQKVRSLERK